jgi:ubiquinone/menaquinone biosynthesis C-methylase UbiE
MDDWRSYDDVAEDYERVHAPRYAETAADLARLADVTTDDHVLDIGTGTGAAAGVAAERGATVTGVDASVEMLLVARRVRPNLAFAAAEAIDLPFRSASFDAILGNFVVEYFTRMDTALFDLVRVAKPGARLAFSSWADEPDAFDEAWLEQVTQVIPRAMLEPSLTQVIPQAHRFRTRDQCQQALYDAGLRRVRVEKVTYEWHYGREEFIEGLEISPIGRFVRGMLGQRGWPAFQERARASFAERFPDPLRDRRDVILSVGVKE